ncbi:MAG: hypothetical protein ACFN4A_09655 [Streptococcus mutans]|uniref:Uncharacterized protein n=1 Tax=Streptococcus anginosus SK1138 TaxID=1161422 RepID=A0AAD2T6J7_STRAP|nr:MULTISPECIES: hypothetical protein [Streptococcus]EJP24487.1 hypothetical protein HMPREF1126_0898 [Streptococcus anginosus SK1138]EUB25649.1 hypothetical protein HMPREF1514_1810 [Streptococcus sp. AS20]MCI3917502.1 hypothetical protein [Streptococcus intermedius]MDX5015622.1 hypothetical protein [Streptococcus anginosus]MDX5019579.1 hypothetical protein [Streptococcus anginosus]
MDLVRTVVGALGVVGTVRGLFGIWQGWEDFSVGKKNDNVQQQERGQSGMLYGGMLAAGASGIAAGIVAALSGLHF